MPLWGARNGVVLYCMWHAAERPVVLSLWPVGTYSTIMSDGRMPGFAAILGGIGNIPGAMFGGVLLGLLEAVAPAMLGMPFQLKDVLAFSILILVLIFRHTGLLGEVLSEKKM